MGRTQKTFLREAGRSASTLPGRRPDPSCDGAGKIVTPVAVANDGNMLDAGERRLQCTPPRDMVYSDEFYTQDSLVKALGIFDLDPCAGPKSHALRNIRLPEDGLIGEWAGRVWLNPPYSNVHYWLAKFLTHRNGVCLVNARTETIWFQNLLRECDGIFLLKGRIDFERPGKKSAHPPCGSVLVAIGAKNIQAIHASTLEGIFLSGHAEA